MANQSIRPLKPLEPGGADWRDRAKNGFDLRSLERLVRDMDQQPQTWRRRSALCHAYYDGKQLTNEQYEFAEQEGLKPRSTNLIGRVINSVLGHEARSRSSPHITSDTDLIADVVDVLNPAMTEAIRESKAHVAVSSAYGGQTKGGIGWTEVSRDQDPLNYPYRVIDVHRDEMYWDWAARDFLLRDARWMVRSKWFDLDELVAVMPQHRMILEQMSNRWEGWALNQLVEEGPELDIMTRAFDDYTRFKIRSSEWLDTVRKRVRIYEIEYKVPAEAVVIKLGPTRTVLFNPKNPLHQIAMQRGLVKVQKVITKQVRRALFAGPYRLEDEGTTRRNFKWIPFIAFRDDQEFTPYGMIEGMISPQDEYNERRLRMQWLLKARQVFADSDALDDTYNNIEDLADEVMRPDMTLILNPGRRNGQNAVQVQSNLELQKEQYEAMQDSRNLIQDVPGYFGPMMGQATNGVTANSAFQTLVEQGAISMGEMNDNYRSSREMTFDAMLELIVEDHSDANLQVIVGEAEVTRVVVLNTFGPDGMPKNMVADAPVRVGFSDGPSTPAARQQEQTMLGEIIKSLGGQPQAVAVLVPPFLENSGLSSETRKQAAADFRRVMGLPAAGDKAARAAAAQQAAEQAQQQQQLNDQMNAGKLDEQHAKAAKFAAEAELADARAKQIRSTTGGGNEQAINDAISEAAGGNVVPLRPASAGPGGSPSPAPAVATGGAG